MPANDYLMKKHNTWFAVLNVPPKLRKAMGRTRFRKSLETSSLADANRLKYAHIAEWKRQIDLQAKGMPDKFAKIREEFITLRQHIAEAPDRWVDDQGREVNWRKELISDMLERASEVADEHGDRVGTQMKMIALSKATFIKDTYGQWLAQFEGTGQTKMQHETAVKRYLSFAGETATIEETSRKRTGEYVNSLLATSGLSRRTIQRHCSSLASLWTWYKARGLTEFAENPWRGHGLAGKKGKAPYRKAYDDALILKLLRTDYGNRYKDTLPDLIRLALLTGARLEVFCAMKKSSVEKREDGYWVTIESDKTDAGTRTIPLHSAGAAIIARRLKGEGEYLFAGLEPGGPDKKRSWYVSKMFNYHRKKAGLIEKGQDFHAFRNTFIACMEGHGVAESTTKLLVGHKRESMTYGHYSKGERVKLREAIEALDYGAGVMKAIRT